MAVTDIRIMVRRVRRAIEGVGTVAVLADSEVKDIIADAMADIILYSGGGVFGNEMLITARGVNGEPVEYATSDELSLPEQAVVAAQAALTYFFFRFQGTKISESIADEGQTWDYTLSSGLLRDGLKYLVDMRDQALASIQEGQLSDSYVSFIEARDQLTSRMIEPWVRGYATGGAQITEGFATFSEQDFRFG